MKRARGKSVGSHWFQRNTILCCLVLGGFFLWGLPVAAETGRFNVHAEVGAGFGLAGWQKEALGTGLFGAARFEYVLADWVGLELGGGYLHFFNGEHPSGYKEIDQAYLAHGGGGARFRILNDENGYWWPWKMNPAHIGNIWGNLWADLHANYYYTGGLSRFGGDIGVGAEISLVNGLQLGPLVRVHYLLQPNSDNDRDSQDAWIMIVGLSFSVAIPPGGKTMVDSDGDGFFDLHDTCPEKPEDKDGFQDDDGCPEEDNDGDGILDADDSCPIFEEDLDGYQDQDGCPDQDNDVDGIPDTEDKCPNSAEDRDAFEDEDGCPESDNDEDGIDDMSDKCPNEPETRNGVDDYDGCPEAKSDEDDVDDRGEDSIADRDGDGIADADDKCPDKKETINGVDDTDGCPDKGLVEVKDNKILLGKRIFFDSGMARVKSGARAVLNHLAQLINSHPEYLRVSIEGHTDKQGDREYNRRLSKRRAENVKSYLVEQGVESERLVIKVFGESAPWVRKQEEDGEKSNRRVEVVILDIDEDLAAIPVSRETKDAVSRAQQEKKASPKKKGKSKEAAPKEKEKSKKAAPKEKEKSKEASPEKTEEKSEDAVDE